jgi:two-component system cell cycle response regulator
MMAEDQIPASEKTVQIKRPTQLGRAAPSKACLVIIGGMDMGRIIPLDQRTITLGRDQECTVVLQDDGVSRTHAEVVLRGSESLLIRDRGSTNGTFVAGRQVTEAVLSRGDKVLLGRRTVLKFEILDEFEQAYQRQMYESSLRDGLTGVYNRKYFNQRMVSDLSFARRHTMWLSLLLFDLDQFQKINDTFGHRNGDRLLADIAGAVLSLLRTEDSLARYGGEEFAVIAHGANYEGGMALANRVLKRVESEAIIAADGTDRIIRTTASIGFAAVTPAMAVEAAAVIAAAEDNLGEAKRGGRNRIVGTLLR